jgi:ribosome-binding protein aMBF1 (putative translation factor)
MSRLPVIEIEGKRYILIAEEQYRKLIDSAQDHLPPLPPADANGYRPALPFIDASIARDIISERRAAGFSQQQLADAAGLRQETLSRIESGKHSPTVRTLKKIEAALKKSPTKPRRKRTSALQPMK